MSEVNLEAPEVKAAIAAEAKKIADEEAGGLKKKNDELLGEVRELKDKLKGVDLEEYKALKAAERDKKDKDSDPVELRKRIEEEFTPKLTAAEQRADEAEAKLKERTIDSELTNALVENGVSKQFLSAVKAEIKASRKVDVTDGGAIVDGKPVAAFAKDFAASEEGKHFVAAANNQGGGGKGGSGGNPAAGPKLSEMNNAQKAAFIKEHGREAFADKVTNESKAQ